MMKPTATRANNNPKPNVVCSRVVSAAVQPQPVLLLLRPVTAVAVLLEDRLHVANEVNLRGLLRVLNSSSEKSGGDSDDSNPDETTHHGSLLSRR